MMKIKKVLSNLKNRITQEDFLTTNVAIVTNPFFIARKGLYEKISFFSPRIMGNILDFGCGSKPYESLFTKAESYIGTDVKISGHNHSKSRIDIFFDGKNLPFKDNCFDSVVCFQVLEHVFDVNNVILELYRVLKPNGTLLLSIPCAWDEHEIPYDFFRYTSYGITKLLTTHHFEVIHLEKTTTYVQTVFQLIITCIHKLFNLKNRTLKVFLQIFLIFPLNLASLFFNFLLPKRYDFFCDSVVVAKKI